MKGKPVIYPVNMTATYKFESSDDLIDVVQNRTGYIYSRWDNPSIMEVEKEMAALEGYDHAAAFSSGMAAITTSVFSHMKSGDRILSTREVYGGTYELFTKVLPNMGIEVVMVNCWDIEKLTSEIEKGIDVLYLESPTNPLLRVMDVAPLVKLAHAKGATVMLDSTFASPVNQHPVDLGVDVTIHSATKFIGGHHDITGGFTCSNEKSFWKIWDYRKILGGVMDPMTGFLAQRGLKTLDIRMERQNNNAMEIALFLEAHPSINSVHYPGLESHPDHEVAKRTLKGYGGMMSFEVNSDFNGTKSVMDRLKVIKLATSLGGVTSLANQPITNTHASLSPEDRKKAGVAENLVRLSVGIEPVATLIDDLAQALKI
ncbi:Cystathionine gamma-lyase [Desulfamplus magnetovallimortis]|uniref:Cystathionine gamma-lyase n=1 Tax=Desulfamplus magnetovallimortis TaxID=1246637 RepID=A0A1W1H7I9_9BACT|nr:aminotransferase class I/II-fold pyridoxal phosphate-dependent enzyme [Desulfamplus magnetovallimortis]SLM28338.1 Cystathionine gamma-lyase [Desulfamplus magnetovallimortis]